MKRIILSLTMIVAVGAIVIASTGAFFSDTETSTGNSFTAGAIDLKIDSEQHYNGNICGVDGKWTGNSAYPVPGSNCGGTWGQPTTDNELGGLDVTEEQFFNFLDLKPGDYGENTISLHVDSNDAWGCAAITIKSDEDVNCTEPEKDDDNTCGTDVSPFNGEIAENLSLAWWPDDGDNVLEIENGEYDKKFFLSGVKLSDLMQDGNPLLLTLADSNQNFFTKSDSGPITGGVTKYVGLAWCFGNMSIDPVTAAITCDGGPVNNASQSDKLVADMSFYVVQARNNDDFRCEDTYK